MSDRGAKTTRKRFGRPPKPSGKVRDHRVVTFVTSSEFEQLSELADVRGKSLSATAHALLVLSLEQFGRHLSDENERRRATVQNGGIQ